MAIGDDIREAAKRQRAARDALTQAARKLSQAQPPAGTGSSGDNNASSGR